MIALKNFEGLYMDYKFCKASHVFYEENRFRVSRLLEFRFSQHRIHHLLEGGTLVYVAVSHRRLPTPV